MASIHREVVVETGPDLVWDAIRDVGAVHERLAPGFVVDTRLEEGARIVTFGNGVVARELIVAVDEAARRLVDLGVTIERVPLDGEGRLDLHHALRALAARGLTRVFSEGGPRVAARLIALGLADQVALITAERPLGRPGVPALAAEARAALLDGSRYRPVETSLYGPDTMRLWERVDGSG